MTEQQQKQCNECSALVDETKGRMVILDQERPTVAGEGDGGGFHWSFLCIQCVRDWRERTQERGVIYRAGTGDVGEGVSFKLRPSILLTFHSEFGEFDLFARNAKVSFGFDTEAKRLLYAHKEA